MEAAPRKLNPNPSFIIVEFSSIYFIILLFIKNFVPEILPNNLVFWLYILLYVRLSWNLIIYISKGLDTFVQANTFKLRFTFQRRMKIKRRAFILKQNKIAQKSYNLNLKHKHIMRRSLIVVHQIFNRLIILNNWI